MTHSKQPEFQSEAERWQAVLQRNQRADGAFFYAVKTTGVYCRPPCGARTPLRQNVTFYESTLEAESQGYRPCKRCKPKSGKARSHAALVEEACRWLEQDEQAPTLDQLAEKAGLSSYYFHRIFKAQTGLTPKAYARAQRGRRSREALGSERSVTDAIYEAGYEASSRFYEEMTPQLGMKPSQYRQGGKGKRIRFTIEKIDLGFLLIAATDKGICLIQFGEDESELEGLLHKHFPRADIQAGETWFRHWTSQILQAIAKGHNPSKDLPLDIRGTAFQQRVWQALREIPAGETASYAQVAASIGKPKAVRAVANACGQNLVALAIPCHRVVRSDGSLGGYRWGVNRKQELLEREKQS